MKDLTKNLNKVINIFITILICLLPIVIVLVILYVHKIPESIKPYIVNLAGFWKYHEGHDTNWINPDYDVSTWKDIKFPSSFHRQHITSKYITVRKQFVLKRNMLNKDLMFFFATTSGSMGTIYFNGQCINKIGIKTDIGIVRDLMDIFGIFIPQNLIRQNNYNVILIEFNNQTLGFNGINDPRIFIGTDDVVKSYHDKNISLSLFFHYGTIFTGFFALCIFIMLLMTDWNSNNKKKYLISVFFMLSIIIFNLSFDTIVVKYFINFDKIVRFAMFSIIFICITNLDYVQYFFINKNNIVSKINKAVCILFMILVLTVKDTVIANKIYFDYFIKYFFCIIFYLCIFSIWYTIKSKNKQSSIIMTTSILAVIGTGISDLLTNLDVYKQPLLFNYTLSIYFIMGAMFIIADFIKISRTNKNLTLKLGRLNMNLETTIEKRTLELTQANKKLKNLDSLKNDFIANISHDFRSPLTVILNTADLLLRGAKDKNFKQQYNAILTSSYRMKSFIDRLLDLAKLDAKAIKLKIEKIDITDCINQTVGYYKSALINTNIKIETKFPEHIVDNFYSDEEKLDEIFSNIISNAIKYISTEDGKIKIIIRDEADAVIITISDNGIGIPEDKLDSIFNRFEQIENDKNTWYRGSGLGLAFVKQLVEYMNGKIWVESGGEDKGATFSIYLPKLIEKKVNEKDVQNNKNNRIKNMQIVNLTKYDLDKKKQNEELDIFIKKRNKENEFNISKSLFLIIDDEPAIAKLIMQYLLLNGFNNFIIAYGGKTGLEAIYNYIPDIILCDYNMPDIFGSKIHDEIIDNPGFKNTPFIFLSAVADKNIINERREKGANAYLRKPIEEKDLILTVNLHLKKYFEYLKTQKLANIDDLTGLFNKSIILKRLYEELSIRKFRDISLIFFDVDRFKRINDNYGHPFGDKILKKIGELVMKLLRPYDVPGHYVGDKFLIILPDTNSENAYKVANNLKKSINSEKIKIGEDDIGFTCSFGISSLITNIAVIEERLEIQGLKNIFEVSSPEKADWKLIEKQKKKIADLLLEFSDKALSLSKSIACSECSYIYNKDKREEKCPRCGSTKRLTDRNRISIYNIES